MSDNAQARLRVSCEHPDRWVWVLAVPGAVLDSGHGDSWGEALTVGLVALELANLTVPTSR